MKSMTGYSYMQVVQEGITASCQMKSLNSRFLDLSIFLPPFLQETEKDFRKLICQNITRGKVDVIFKVFDANLCCTVETNINLATEYSNALKKIATALNRQDDVPLSLILSQEGIIEVQCKYDAEKYKAILFPLLQQTMQAFVLELQKEGDVLKCDIMQKLDILDGCADFFALWQPKMEEAFKRQIENRFKELLEDAFEPQRVMQEVASLLTKYTINEEIVRLKSHLASLRQEIMQNQTPGKKIDFLAQEANREINTIGSKNQSLEVAQKVVVAKDAIENIREQARNVA